MPGPRAGAGLILAALCLAGHTTRSSAFSARSPLPGLQARPLVLSPRAAPRRPAAAAVQMKEDKGFFGNMMDKALLKLIEVKEKEGAKKNLQECVFCEKGQLKCEGCEGTGKDIALGGKNKCFLCAGKGKRECTVCNGIGLVDKVRRGGTDTKGEWLGKEKEAMDPLIPQYAPYILELDEATRYVWCQCGVSMKQPFCDSNSHRAYGIKPVAFKTEGVEGKKRKVELCGCKYTNTPPYCDGTHVALKAKADATGTV